jgi:hypothetical protein
MYLLSALLVGSLKLKSPTSRWKNSFFPKHKTKKVKQQTTPTAIPLISNNMTSLVENYVFANVALQALLKDNSLTLSQKFIRMVELNKTKQVFHR